jgi:hypothetical protein
MADMAYEATVGTVEATQEMDVQFGLLVTRQEICRNRSNPVRFGRGRM